MAGIAQHFTMLSCFVIFAAHAQVNGEIYNHEALKASLKDKHSFATASDCEIIAHLVSRKVRHGTHNVIRGRGR